MALTAGQRICLQYINDNVPTKAELLTQVSTPSHWLFNILPLKMWAYAIYDGVADTWTITAAGITELAS